MRPQLCNWAMPTCTTQHLSTSSFCTCAVFASSGQGVLSKEPGSDKSKRQNDSAQHIQKSGKPMHAILMNFDLFSCLPRQMVWAVLGNVVPTCSKHFAELHSALLELYQECQSLVKQLLKVRAPWLKKPRSRHTAWTWSA